MNLGQPPPTLTHPTQKDSGEPFSWIVRPTLQLKIKANSWNEFRPPPPKKDSGEPFSWKLRPTLQLKIKANSWNEFWPTPFPPKDSGEPFSWKLRPTLGMNSGQSPSPQKIQVNPSAEN